LRRPRQGCQTFRALLYSSIDMGTLHLQRPVFNYISWLPGVKFSPRGELGPHGLTLSPSWLVLPFVHPQGWTHSNVLKNEGENRVSSPLGANFIPGGAVKFFKLAFHVTLHICTLVAWRSGHRRVSGFLSNHVNYLV
jgi:hypothetical protein